MYHFLFTCCCIKINLISSLYFPQNIPSEDAGLEYFESGMTLQIISLLRTAHVVVFNNKCTCYHWTNRLLARETPLCSPIVKEWSHVSVCHDDTWPRPSLDRQLQVPPPRCLITTAGQHIERRAEGRKTSLQPAFTRKTSLLGLLLLHTRRLRFSRSFPSAGRMLRLSDGAVLQKNS